MNRESGIGSQVGESGIGSQVGESGVGSQGYFDALFRPRACHFVSIEMCGTIFVVVMVYETCKTIYSIHYAWLRGTSCGVYAYYFA